MAVETKYVCDRCNHTQAVYEQMWFVSVVINHFPVTVSSYNSNTVTKLWCRKCVDELNFIGFKSKSIDVEPPKELTFEEKIREIIVDEINKAK